MSTPADLAALHRLVHQWDDRLAAHQRRIRALQMAKPDADLSYHVLLLALTEDLRALALDVQGVEEPAQPVVKVTA